MAKDRATDRGSGRRIDPGSGRRHSPAFAKGRQLEPAARVEVAALLGDRPRDRDLLIEHLHLIQDAYGCLQRGAPAGAGGGDASCDGRGLRGRFILCAFRHRARRRDAAAAPDGPGLRQPDLRVLPARDDSAGRAARQTGRRRAGCPRALHGALRRRRRSCEVGHRHVDHATPTRCCGSGGRAATCIP